MYGFKVWEISKHLQNKQEASKMWFLRGMIRILWIAKQKKTKNQTRLHEEARSHTNKMHERLAMVLGRVVRIEKL